MYKSALHIGAVAFFHPASAIDETTAAQAQADLSRRILRAFVGRGLIEKADAKQMLGHQYSGFSVDAGVGASNRFALATTRPPWCCTTCHWMSQSGALRAGGPRRQRQVHAASLLLRFYQAQSGRVTLDGVELSRFGDAHFRADVGLMPQDPFLLASSVRDNISVGRALGQAEIETAARATHCHDSIVQLEQGIYQRLCLLQQLGESSVFGSDG